MRVNVRRAYRWRVPERWKARFRARMAVVQVFLELWFGDGGQGEEGERGGEL